MLTSARLSAASPKSVGVSRLWDRRAGPGVCLADDMPLLWPAVGGSDSGQESSRSSRPGTSSISSWSRLKPKSGGSKVADFLTLGLSRTSCVELRRIDVACGDGEGLEL